MPVPDDLTLGIRHWAPVRLRHRAGLPERIGFDPMSTPVRIRGVDRDALAIVDLPIETYENKLPGTVRAYGLDGTLWRRIENAEGEPASVEEAVRILSGDAAAGKSPFRPRLPEAHGMRAFPGDAAMPPRTLARASLRLHDVAAAKVRSVAEHGLIHDGRGVLAAMDHPLLPFGKLKRRAFLGWRDIDKGWGPLFRHDRPLDVATMQSTLGISIAEVAADQAVKRELSAGLVEAMRGIAVRDDDLRHFINGAAFAVADCLAGHEEADRPPGAERALGELCARASIDAVDADPRLVFALFRSVTRDASSRIRGAEHNDLRNIAFRIDRYLTQVVEPRLAGGPVPGEDIEALGALTP